MDYSMYKPKVKKPYTGPPRPNLMSHDKVIREQKLSLEQLQAQNHDLTRRLERLESKLANQTAYLNSLHQYVHTKLKSRG